MSSSPLFTAFNHGVRLARGELFLPADSDDAFPPNVLERFVDHWRAIPENERQLFVGVCGLCQDGQENLVGEAFPGGWGMDSDSLEMRYFYGVRGESGCLVGLMFCALIRFQNTCLGMYRKGWYGRLLLPITKPAS